ncbi:MAG: Ig-like domain-containing protein [Lachnospiraceae bacterium]|nr:Ig-like domain-containing protein [Lachnospiraceae bacterium]
MIKRSMLKALSLYMAFAMVMTAFSPAVVSAAEAEPFEADEAAELVEEVELAESYEEVTGAGEISWRDRINVDGFAACAGYEEGAYAEWLSVSDAAGYEAYVKKASDADSAYVKLDDELIRKYKDYWRVDALGLKGGESYVIKVVALNASGATVASAVTDELSVKAHDRSGFAWKNGTASGAYNEDGTLASNAVVIYVTDANKDSVTASIDAGGKGTLTEYTGIGNIMLGLKKGKDNRKFDIRIIGNIGVAETLGGDNNSEYKGDWCIQNGNNASMGITVEGVGEDAVANGWGVRVKGASNVEVRNLAFMNCCSGEGDDVGLQQDNDHVWVHNCDMFYGNAGTDSDQVKGDGALDCKKSNYATFSYNHFWDCGKCNLLGLSENDKNLYVTYHHNWYDHSDSRHPRIRYFCTHVYNNYYDGNAKYGVGAAKGGPSVFVENNYFRNVKSPMMISMQGTDVYSTGDTRNTTDYPTFSKEDGGIIKAYNNAFVGKCTFVPYGGQYFTLEGVKTEYNRATSSTEDFDAYVVTSREEEVPATVTTYQGGFTYDNTKMAVSNLNVDSANIDDVMDVPEIVKAGAGRVNGGDFWYNFDDVAEDENYEVNWDLKRLITDYKTALVSVGGTDPEPVPAGSNDTDRTVTERIEKTAVSNTDGVVYDPGEGASGATGGNTATIDDIFRADDFISDIMLKTNWTPDQSGVNISTFANFSEDWLTINGANGTVFRLSDATTCKSAADKVGLAKGIGYMEVTVSEDGILKVSCCSDGQKNTSTMQVTDAQKNPVADTKGNTTHTLTGKEAVTLSFEVTAGTYRIGYVTEDTEQKSIRLTQVKFSVPTEDDRIPVEAVFIDPSEDFDLEVGETKTITATISPNNATDKTVSWRSSDTKVATVFRGVVKGVAAGTAVITAASGTKGASVKVTVKASSTGGDEPGGDEPGGDNPGGDTPGGDDPGTDDPKPGDQVKPTVSMAFIPLILGDKTCTISYNKVVQYTGGKVELSDISIDGAKVGQVIPGTQVLFAKVKYKNNKNVGTQAKATIVLKANKGADKSVKNMVKAANKTLKTSPVSFEIIPRTLTADKVSGTAQYSTKKGKWKFKLTVNVGGKKPLKLKFNKKSAKTDFTPNAFAPAADGTYPSMVSITGTNNFKGSVSVNVIVK